MRIVIATAVYHPQINGVAVFSHNLAVGLARRGHEVMVICPSQTGKNYTKAIDGVRTVYLRSVQAKVYPDQIHPVPPKVKFHGVRLPRLLYKHGFRVSVFPANEVKKALSDFRPDVVHVQVSDPIGLSVVYYARKRGIPVVTTEHNQPEVLTDSLKLPRMVKKGANAVLAAYFRNRQSKSDFVTMPTKQAIYNLLKEKELDVPIAAVSNGVDLANFRPGEVAASFYKKYHLPAERPIVLYVGRVDPEKDIETVIKAFKEARTKLPKTGVKPLLLIVGDGVDKARLENLAEKLELGNDVRFLGKVVTPDLYDIYRTGAVFVTASPIETQGIVLIEAAATGLPLIAVDKGAVSEVCITGKNGFLCKPGDIAEIAEATVRILSDSKLRRKFAANSIKIAAEHDMEKTLDKFINIYQKLSAAR